MGIRQCPLIFMLFITLIISPSYCYKINERVGPISEDEDKEMNNIADQLSQFYLIKIQGNSTQINITTMQQELLKPVQKLANHTDSILCKVCLWTFSKFHNLLKKHYGVPLIQKIIARLCSLGLDYTVCKGAIELYTDIVLDSLIDRYLNAEYICTHPIICEFAHYQELDPDEYARNLLKDKPKNIKPIINAEGRTLKVLHATDIHTDTLYYEVNKNI